VGIVRRLPDAVQELEPLLELLFGQPDLAGEGMHVADEGRHHLP
jgi:hypothetical protein